MQNRGNKLNNRSARFFESMQTVHGFKKRFAFLLCYYSTYCLGSLSILFLIAAQCDGPAVQRSGFSQKTSTSISGTCVQDDDCPSVGQFCSAGICYESAGRNTCVHSFSCAIDERCDLRSKLCVPDLGGCSRCEQNSELCCETGMTCSQQTDRCVRLMKSMCTDDNAKEVCRVNQKCHRGQCVQCVANQDCGPGTACDLESGTCYSVLNRCNQDSDCGDGKRCVLSSHECVVPECKMDSECLQKDKRYRCSTSSFRCFLPEPVCTEETQKTSHTFESAKPLEGSAMVGEICRGRTGYFYFRAKPKKRYRIRTHMAGNSQGVVVSLLKDTGDLIRSKSFSEIPETLTLTADNHLDVEKSYYLKLQAKGFGQDQFAYDVKMEEYGLPEPVNCEQTKKQGPEKIELVSNQKKTLVFHRCGKKEVGVYEFEIPLQHRVEASLDFSKDSGELDFFICKGPRCQSRFDLDVVGKAGYETDENAINLGEGFSKLTAKIQLKTTGLHVDDWDENQTYELTLLLKARPEECAQDTGEPADDQMSGARELLSHQPLQALRCLQDVDFYHVRVPAGMGAKIRLTSERAQGALRLDQVNAEGATLSSVEEELRIHPKTSEQNFWLKVRLSGGSQTLAQPYTIENVFYREQDIP